MIKAQNFITVYKAFCPDGNKLEEPPALLVCNDINKDMVILEYKGNKITVSADDLHKAINNATNR